MFNVIIKTASSCQIWNVVPKRNSTNMTAPKAGDESVGWLVLSIGKFLFFALL
jgi:hypothetical protein